MVGPTPKPPPRIEDLRARKTALTAEKTATRIGVPLITGPQPEGLKLPLAGPPAQRVGEQRGTVLEPGGPPGKSALRQPAGPPVPTGLGPCAVKTRRPPGVGGAWRVAEQ